MNDNEIINKAIQELKQSEKPYKMFKDFSFMDGIEWGDDRFQKIRFLLVKSTPFEKHTDHALKFSEIGLDISNNHKDWFDYKKSLKPKKEYVKWIGVIIAALSLIWNVYQNKITNDLKTENKAIQDKFELMSKSNELLGFKTTFLAELGDEKYDDLEKKVKNKAIETKYLNDIIYVSYYEEVNACGQYSGVINTSNDTINLKLNLISDEVCTSLAIEKVTFIINNSDKKKKVIIK